MSQQTVLAPSILSADHGRLKEEIRAVEQAGADRIHIDVMDGHFVPNLTLGPPIIRSLRGVTKLPFGVHLMIEKPELSLSQYAEAGADILIVHAEACVHLHRTLAQIRELKVQPGVAVNPATPLTCLVHVLELVDEVLVMTVNPGFGGQAFIEAMLPKIRTLRRELDSRGLKARLAVDGGVDEQTIGRVAAAGADTFIAGSAVFRRQDVGAALQALRRAIVPYAADPAPP